MAFCRYCGKMLNDGDSVCPYCGKNIDSASASIPVQKGSNKMTKLNTILSVVLIIVMIVAAVAFLIPPAEEDTKEYKVTIKIDSFYVLDQSGQLDPDDHIAETYFSIGYGSEEQVNKNTYNWNTRDAGTWDVVIYDSNPTIYSPQSNNSFSFDTDTSPDDLYFTIFMLDFDTVSGNTVISDTIDLYTPSTIIGVSPEYAGFSGVRFDLTGFETTDGEYMIELTGDSDPIGYVKLIITIEELA